MARPHRVALAVLALPVVAALVVACGEQGVQVAQESPYRQGAELFSERCSGCHTLSYAGAEGSAEAIGDRERTDGPSFDTRKEIRVADVLYAIRNGGFSGAIMPQNIVVGEEARKVAEFVVACSGKDAKQPKAPGTPPTPPPSKEC